MAKSKSRSPRRSAPKPKATQPSGPGDVFERIADALDAVDAWDRRKATGSAMFSLKIPSVSRKACPQITLSYGERAAWASPHS